MSFRRFIAVDWSGAKKPGYTGVAVAECRPGRAAPRLVCNPRGRHWRRGDVRDWLSDQIATDGPVLIDVVTNPSELSLPPKTTLEQARGYSLYLMKEILGGGAGDVLEALESNVR